MGTVEIVYFVHATTTDNERGLATGWGDAELSELGLRQAAESAKLLKNEKFEVIFCSDMKRAVDTAEIVWGGSVEIIRDERLRECNYGDLTGEKTSEVKKNMARHINKPFPNGESYREVEMRIRSFLEYLVVSRAGNRVAIVAHQAPQLALDVIINGKTWKQAIEEDWRNKQPKKWQLGWKYILKPLI